MKKIFFFFFLSGILFSCEDPKVTKEPALVAPEATAEEKASPCYRPTDLTKVAPPTNEPNIGGRMKHVLGKYWWYEGYVSSRPQTTACRRGDWYLFNADGTFLYGKFQREIGYGTWRYDEANETIFNKTQDGSETMQWKTLMSHTNDKWVWMGPSVGPNKGDQGMLQPYLQKPNDEDIFWVTPKVETREEPVEEVNE